MKKILLLSTFIFSISFAQDICQKASEYSVYCYQLREDKKVKSCDEAVQLIQDKIKDKKLKEWAEKACQYGCLSESLHEANQMEKFIKDECQRGK